MLKMKRPFLIFVIVTYLFFSLSLLLDEPFVWPDEAIYGDISNNILLEGRMGTDLWKGLVNGIENHSYSLPPLFLYSNALWFKLFGFSITTQRLFPVFLATVFIVIFYNLTQKLILSMNKQHTRFLPLAASLMLVIDSVFLKASRLSRPEILVLVLTASSVLFCLQSFEAKNNIKNRFLFLCGISLGLAITTHFIAIGFTAAITLAIIYSQPKNRFDIKKYYVFVIGLLFPIIAWIASIFPNYGYLVDQLNLVEKSRHYTIPWYINVLNFPFLMKLNYVFYLLISCSFVFFTLKNRKPVYVLLSLVLVFTWAFATLGEIYWYTIYAIPFAYLALFILIAHALKSNRKNMLSTLIKSVLLIICLIILYSNLTNFMGLFGIYRNANNYGLFTTQVTKAVPEGKTIYLSSIPDAYYAFDRSKNRLIEFPALFSNMERFKKVLLEVDYIVFNGIYTPDPEAATYFDKYIAKNLESVQELTYPYKILIIKLKDKHLRTDAI